MLLAVAGVLSLPGTAADVSSGIHALADFDEGIGAWQGPGQLARGEGRIGGGLRVPGRYAMSPTQGRIEVSEPRDLEISAWIKCTGCPLRSAGIAVLARDANGEVSGTWIEGERPRYWMDNGRSAVLAANETTDWERLVGRIPAQSIPPGARALDIYLRSDLDAAGDQVALFDDLSIAELPDGAVGIKQLIRNGGFETGSCPWWGKAGEIVTTTAFAGDRSMAVRGGFVAQDKRPIQPGTNYRITIAVKTVDAPKDAVYAQLSYRGDGVKPGWYGQAHAPLSGRSEKALLVTGGTSDWQRHSITVRPPEGARELLLYLRKKKGTPGVAYFDAVTVNATDEPPTTEAMSRLQQLRSRLFGEDQEPPTVSRLGSERKEVVLADSQVAHLRIAVQPAPDLVVLHAAGEIADYLQRITGGDFLPLQEGTAPQQRGTIAIGAGMAWMRRFFPSVDASTLGADGFAITAANGRIAIGAGTSRGAMYGVNWFLDRKLGVKWLSPDFTYVPKTDRLSVQNFATVQVPRFTYREVLSREAADKRFRAHNLLNGESHGPSFLDSPPEIHVWDRSWLAKGGKANFWQLAKRKANLKRHPDWFAGGQVAMMNPSLRQQVAASVIERLQQRAEHASVWFDVHDMDWGWDMDADSASFARRHGGKPSAPRLDMMIDVARQVRETLPDARLAFNAYHWSFSPPEAMRVPDHILVFPMTIHVDYSTALDRGNNRQLGADLVGWNRIAQHVLVWDHIANFSGFLQPTPNIFPIAESVKWLATLDNVQGYFAEGSWNTLAGEFSALRAWMLSRLLWDPTLDPRQVVREFCTHYYGPAAQPVMRYIDLMHDAIERSGDVLAEKTQVDLKMFDVDFVTQSDALFDQAEALAANDPARLRHVQIARMPIDYVAAARHLDLRKSARAQGAAWPDSNDTRVDRLLHTAEAAGVRQYRQGGTLKEMERMLRIERTDPPKTPPSAVVPSQSEWRDFQDLSFNRYGTTAIVADTQASDGSAAWIQPGKNGWLIQFKLDKLPSSGLWDLYVALRPESVGKSHDKAFAKVGSYPPMNRFTAVKHAISDTAYQHIKVPGGPFERQVDHSRGIYVQSQTAKDAGVLVDRILAVRVQ